MLSRIHYNSNTKIAIIINESTTISKKSALIIYVKASLPDPITFYLDTIELDHKGAECIFSTLMKCVDMYGFTSSLLSEKLLCFASDGASVMLGSRSGVASRIQQVFLNVIVWHCMNHRLELAVGDAVNEVSGTNHFKVSYTAYIILLQKTEESLKIFAVIWHAYFTLLGVY